MQIYSGSSNKPLARKISEKCECTYGSIELSEFPNKEIRVWITEPKVEKEVAVVQSFAADPNHAIIEFALIVDALKRSGAKSITAVIPWMGYCIQDKIFRQGEPLSARVVADLIQSTGIDKVITVDLHNETTLGFFSVPVVHLSAMPLFIDHFNKTREIDCIVSPDVGALKEMSKVAQALELPVVILSKRRDLATGRVEILGFQGDVKGKTCLITDDFINTGSTLIQTAAFLHDHQAKRVICAVTHHLFVEGVQHKFAHSQIDDLYITDTVRMPERDQEEKGTLTVHITSVAEMIAQQLQD